MGDGILAYFGYPTAHENEAERAVRAALELIDRVPTLDTSVQDTTVQALPPLHVHIGVHSGLVLMTQEIGSGGFTKQSATGGVLSLAARLQTEAAPGTVIASRETIELVAGQFEYLPLGARSLKGIARPIEIYRVVRPLPAAPRSAANRMLGGVTRMVGRDAALAKVLMRWKSVCQRRRCETVTVVGDAGIGKTRLVTELFSRPEFANSIITQTPCHDIFASTPLYAVGSFLWARAGLAVQDDEATTDRKISNSLRNLP